MSTKKDAPTGGAADSLAAGSNYTTRPTLPQYLDASYIGRALGGKMQADGSWLCSCPNGAIHKHGDKNPSFTVTDAPNATPPVLVHCWVCDKNTVIGVLKNRGLWPIALDIPKALKRVKVKTQEEHTVTWADRVGRKYDFCDVNGRLRYQKGRIKDTKIFLFRVPDPTLDDWIYMQKDVRKIEDYVPDHERVLFNLPAAVNAILDGKPVVIVEGEGDVLTLAEIGITAVSADSGSGSHWPHDMYDVLRKGDLYFCADNDKPGEKYRDRICGDFKKMGVTVKVIELPGVPENGGDVTDWLRMDGITPDLFMGCLELAEPWQPPKRTQLEIAPPAPGGGNNNIIRFPAVCPDSLRPFTEAGNGDRFVEKYGDIVRWDSARKVWLIWNGRRWEINESGALIKRLAEKVAMDISLESHQDVAVYKGHVTKTLSNRGLQNMLEAAQHRENISMAADDFDKDPYLVNFENCLVDLRTGQPAKQAREQYCTKVLNCKYNPKAKTPRRWLRFLLEVMQHDKEMVRFLQRAIGYSLSGSMTAQKSFFLYGDGSNGKSVFLKVILIIMGEYARGGGAETWMKQFGNRDHSQNLVHFVGKRMIVAGEIGTSDRLDEARYKGWVGGDRQIGRSLYANNVVEFVPQGKLWLYGNQKPIITDNTKGTWRRMLLVPFLASIPTHKQNHNLVNELLEEVEGIALWILAGFRQWQQIGLSAPKKIADATADYQRESNVLGQACEEIVVEDPAEWCSSADFNTAYRLWCQENGHEPESMRQLGPKLRIRGYDKRCAPTVDRRNGWKGFKLTETWLLKVQHENQRKNR